MCYAKHFVDATCMCYASPSSQKVVGCNYYINGQIIDIYNNDPSLLSLTELQVGHLSKTW